MPQLPERIWKRRLESEYEEMKAKAESDKSFSFTVNAEKTIYLITINAAAYKKGTRGEMERVGRHQVEIRLSREYPYAGGIYLLWKTPIFHPNIRASDGMVCIRMINNWSESQTIANIVDAIRQVLENPNPDDPLDEEAAKYFKERGMGKRRESSRRGGPRVVA